MSTENRYFKTLRRSFVLARTTDLAPVGDFALSKVHHTSQRCKVSEGDQSFGIGKNSRPRMLHTRQRSSSTTTSTKVRTITRRRLSSFLIVPTTFPAEDDNDYCSIITFGRAGHPLCILCQPKIGISTPCEGSFVMIRTTDSAPVGDFAPSKVHHMLLLTAKEFIAVSFN